MYALVVNDWGASYFTPFSHLSLEYTDNKDLLRESPEKIGLVVFTGGEDVDPSIYGEKNVSSYSNISRDEEEVALWKIARDHNIPIGGICRGAQLICALSGGRLIQDVSGHTQSHKVMWRLPAGFNRLVGESPESITSSHHQMQYPWNLPSEDFEVLAWSVSPRSNHYRMSDGTIYIEYADDQLKMEPDVVWYRKTGAIAIQYHPEWMDEENWGMRFAREIISRTIGDAVKCRIEEQNRLIQA